MRLKALLAVGLTIFAFMAAIWPALAQNADEFGKLRMEIEALKQGQAVIREQLKAIHKLLEQATRPRVAQAVAPQQVLLRGLADDPVLGDKDAKLMLVEFTDYQCPFCRRYATSTLVQIKQAYVSTGKIRYVVRDFPIPQLHPNALNAAQAANCAADRGKYWEMHDLLFRNQRQLGLEQLPGHAKTLGLDVDAFKKCLASGKHKAEILQDVADGRSAGVTGTPSFFLAVDGPEPGTARTLTMIRGAVPFAAFKAVIDSALAGLATTPKAGVPKVKNGKRN